LRAFVAQNADYYLGKWRQISASGKPNSWNWAAFFLNAFWLAYRKMWTPALAAAGAILLVQLAGLFVRELQSLSSGLVLGVCAWVGWRGNSLYRAHADQTVAQVSAMNPDRHGQIAWLQGQGGVALPAALGLAAGVMVVWYLLIFVIAN